ncbi:uncharacterized protein CANTADRAFT_339244 [Suhomyces tanzawaensis NRRL Y-17324]|uniref:Uncharacterized protein n=1 Tax=Suhomyces tanzawaensis NRRL Y-17324 TaxID=984487 RepID=A0A1E4SJA3_9ASCO|nr:uncharacterized protein CANTADRAFT_339244 [Suhomyces tanzawaensis NRRL Y-17324]ODV79581.1 hypothetical protein CANTADRAFT_339244 [Suhomyces tanzawaensis NRRL Y-17324]
MVRASTDGSKSVKNFSSAKHLPAANSRRILAAKTINTAASLREIFKKKPKGTKAKASSRNHLLGIQLKDVSFQATSTPSNSLIHEPLEAYKVEEIQKQIVARKTETQGNNNTAKRKKKRFRGLQTKKTSATAEDVLLIQNCMQGIEENELKDREVFPNANQEVELESVRTINQNMSTKILKVNKFIEKIGNQSSAATEGTLKDPIDLLRNRRYHLIARRIKQVATDKNLL